jgi:glycosyltransferase involved in cell wall biosynthesis
MEGAKVNLTLYRKAVNRITLFVTQNQQQSDNLFRFYGKHSIIIPNIWPTESVSGDGNRHYDAVWVANLRRLKRAEWFVNLARKLPQYKFAIAGGVNEQDYYDHIKKICETVPNIEFLGAQSLNAVSNLMGQSKLLVCTSEYEGFPNTFLQAWANDVPIVSTVNPSNCITEFGLGTMIENESQLQPAVARLLNSDELYNQCQQNIKQYFVLHHDADMAYQEVMKLITE